MILGIYGSGGLGREVLELARIINTWEKIIFIDDGGGGEEKRGGKFINIRKR